MALMLHRVPSESEAGWIGCQSNFLLDTRFNVHTSHLRCPLSLADPLNKSATCKVLPVESNGGTRGRTAVASSLLSRVDPSLYARKGLHWADSHELPSSSFQSALHRSGQRIRLESQIRTRALPEFLDWAWQLPDEGPARDFLFASLGATLAFTLATAAASVWRREESRLRETSAERGLAALPEPSTTAGQKESVEWVNMVLQKIWRVYRRSLEAWLVGLLQPAIDQLPLPPYVRRVEIAELSLNYDPILVRNVQRRASRQANDLQYHIGLRYTGGARCVLKLHVEQNGMRTVIPVGVRDLDVDGEMWVKLRLTPRKPYVGMLSIAFVRLPTIKLVLAPFRVVNVFAIPFLSRFLSKLLTVDLPRLLVLPRTLTFDFLPSGEGFSTGPSDPSVHTVLDLLTTETLSGLATQVEEPSEHFVGELTVTLCDARNLPTWNLSGWSNPFCVLTLGEQVVESKRNRETSHPAGSTDPVWNQDFQFWVEDPLHQKLTVRIRDAAITLHPDIGYIEIPTWQLQDCVPMSVSLPLMRDGPFGTKPVQGELRLLLTYKSYVDEEADKRKHGLEPPVPIVIKVFSEGESSDSDKSGGLGSDSDSDSDSASRVIQVDNEELALADAVAQAEVAAQLTASAVGMRDRSSQQQVPLSKFSNSRAETSESTRSGQLDRKAGIAEALSSDSQRDSSVSFTDRTSENSVTVVPGGVQSEPSLPRGAKGVAIGVGNWISSVAVPQAVNVGDHALRGSLDAGKWAVGATMDLWGKLRKEKGEDTRTPDANDVSKSWQQPDRSPEHTIRRQNSTDGATDHSIDSAMEYKVQPAYLRIPDSNVLSRLNDEEDSSDDEDGTTGGGASRARQGATEGGWVASGGAPNGDGYTASGEGKSSGKWMGVVGREAGRLKHAGAATWGWICSVLPGERGENSANGRPADPMKDGPSVQRRASTGGDSAAPPPLPPFYSSVTEERQGRNDDYRSVEPAYLSVQPVQEQILKTQAQPRQHWYDERPDDVAASPAEPSQQQPPHQREHLRQARDAYQDGDVNTPVERLIQESAEVRAHVVSRLESSLVRSPSGTLLREERLENGNEDDPSLEQGTQRAP
eukprot:TRINITY_DN23173_c0_g1_i1.p1 TRINITY_DN23173_c0_g1~~TRINITY_DN23173_c0_g1_i1.p1  ORF type:complete len:1089 (-),score=143.19 TRINITY_DN23173_c0_g1_i1:302-3568(-)